MVKIRLSLHGSKRKPFYKIIIADSRCPRNGRFIEQIGFFDPHNTIKKNIVNINMERVNFWIKNGAIPSNRVKKIINIQKKIVKI